MASLANIRFGGTTPKYVKHRGAYVSKVYKGQTLVYDNSSRIRLKAEAWVSHRLNTDSYWASCGNSEDVYSSDLILLGTRVSVVGDNAWGNIVWHDVAIPYIDGWTRSIGYLYFDGGENWINRLIHYADGHCSSPAFTLRFGACFNAGKSRGEGDNFYWGGDGGIELAIPSLYNCDDRKYETQSGVVSEVE